MQIIWKEASAAWFWPTYWPTDPEYIALRSAKQLWDTSGPNQSWCNCAAGCNHGDRSWAAHAVERELTKEGYQKWAAVKAARNSYGYESVLYSDCGQIRRVEMKMRWNGVPLKTGEQNARQKIGVLHGTVVHHHFDAPQHVHHGPPADQRVIAEAAHILRNFRSTW